MAEMEDVKARHRQMWGSADYAAIGARIVSVSEWLCDAVDVRGGEGVLDVACGTGNAALAASRRFADVVGVDYQPDLLDHARARAAVEGLPVRFEEGDAEALPCGDDAFDAVVSACGAMFAPDQDATAGELVRVCRPGGRIGMVNWTPDSWVAQLGALVGRYVPPPPGLTPPVRWGDPDHVAGLFGDRVDLRTTTRRFPFHFVSAAQHADFFCDRYPPIVAAMGRLDEDQQAALRAEVEDLARSFDVAEDGRGTVVPLDYLEVVATVR